MESRTNEAQGPRAKVTARQWIAIAVLALLGTVGAALILGTEPRTPASQENEGESAKGASHADGHAAGDDHGPARRPPGHAAGEAPHAAASSPARLAERATRAGASATVASVGAPHAGESHAEGSSDALLPMDEAQMQAAGIALDTAGPALLRDTLELAGEIRFNEDRTAHVVPRVAGIVESVPVALGESVKRGQLLAVVSSATVSELRSELRASRKRAQLARTTYEREKKLWEEKISPHQDVLQAEQALREAEIAEANAGQKLKAVGAPEGSASLNRFELRAPFDGVIVEKHIALGEQVKEDASIFTLSDLRTVWAQIEVPARDLPRMRVGQKVAIRSSAFEQTASGAVAYVGSLIGAQTRTAQARVTVDNPGTVWRPGLFVSVQVTSGETRAPVTVARDAVQSLQDRNVVFLRVPMGFAAQPVKLGRDDGQRVEILEGLTAGSRVAARGSFVLKSEAGKASASHAH